ncbi:leucine-rich repeat domain-containing protein [Butyrivibrio sp. MC2021]|uniref:leucine-rich repeat domain-containing protein n=1 Tax=Butyrivibrio sp. MC2021 TaxID=1408306 RepID=UPI000479DF42|nr:leucine-rich repeat domain-containing protein [Butyrivibrio sp. MC2021]
MGKNVRIAALILGAALLFDNGLALPSVSAAEPYGAEESDYSEEYSPEEITIEDNSIKEPSEEIILEEETSALSEDASLLDESTDKPATSGTCGENATWTFERGILTISGSGDIKDYTKDEPAPWADACSHRDFKLVIGDEITRIGDYAFYDHPFIANITIGKGIKSVGAFAFCGVIDGAKSITFPASLEEFDMSALACSRFSKVIFLGDAPKICDPKVHGGAYVLGSCVYYGGSGWTDEYTREFTNAFMWPYPDQEGSIPFYSLNREINNKCGENVIWELVDSTNYKDSKKLVISGSGAMTDYSISNAAPWRELGREIREVEIENGVTHIGDYSFAQTSNLRRFSIPKTVKTVGKYVFYAITSIDSITIEDGTSFESVGDFAFAELLFAKEVKGIAAAIKNAKTIGQDSFFAASFSEFENLELNADYIGKCAFGSCDIGNLKFGDKAKTIGYAAFCDCGEIKTIDIGTGVKTIKENAFSGTRVETFVLPKTVVTAETTCCPSITKSLYVYKNISDINIVYSSLFSLWPEDVEVHFYGDYITNIDKITYKKFNIYFPVNNKGWYDGIDELGKTTATFIPEGEPDYMTVRFVTNCDKTLENQKVAFGSYVTEPKISYDGHVLEGWYADSTFKTKYVFGKRVFKDVKIYAKWTKAPEEGDDVPEDDWGDVTEEDIKEQGFKSPADVPEGIWCAGSSQSLVYNGKAKKLSALHVYDYKKLLRVKKDYTVKYKNNVKAGTASVTVTLKGKLRTKLAKENKGKLKVDFVIEPLNLTELAKKGSITADGVEYKMAFENTYFYRYTGNRIKVKPSLVIYRNDKKITLKKNRDFILSSSAEDDFTEVGTHKVFVEGKGNYLATDKLTIDAVITDKLLMKNAKVSAIKARTHTGEEIRIDNLTVKYGKKTLMEGTDYTLEYFDNVLPGKASIVITGKGDYAGTKKVTFTIKE